MAKMQILGKGFEELAETIDSFGDGLKPAVAKALEKSVNAVTPQLKSAMPPHSVKYTGKTQKAILEGQKTTWQGSIASIAVGFAQKTGWKSNFLIYGTPRYPKDQKLYNAFFGSKTKKEISKSQAQVMNSYIKDTSRKK